MECTKVLGQIFNFRIPKEVKSYEVMSEFTPLACIYCENCILIVSNATKYIVTNKGLDSYKSAIFTTDLSDERKSQLGQNYHLEITEFKYKTTNDTI